MERWQGRGCRAFRDGLRSLVVLVSCSGFVACHDDEGQVPAPEPSPGGRGDEGYTPDSAPDLCARRILEIEREKQPSPTPLFDEHRAELLARARSAPIVFRQRPRDPAPGSAIVEELRASLLKEEDPAPAILEVLRRTRGNYPLRREVFLSEHYLYAETPVLALRLSQVLRLDHLFSKAEGELVIERGTETFTVKRNEGMYFLPPLTDDDPNATHQPRVASLLLFDRVRTTSEVFGPPLHLDLRPLERQLGFSTARITTWSKDALVADLSTYGTKSRAVFTFLGTEARLECETPGETPISDLATARKNFHLDQELIDPVLEAAHEMIFRQLPFDEPKTEEGQQDGLLRMHFKQAYQHYAHTYEFNGDSYYIFDGYGRPRLPQVCIDFITDAFDWGTGGHWPERGKKREYVRGALNFASMGMENARSVENLADFASQHPEWFDVLWLPEEERVKFRHRTKFFQHLARHSERYQRGDIVFIYGLRDDGKFHYHSFLIDEKDPVTGMPTVVLANAGPPQARSWEGEMQNAPGRSIVARVRVRRNVLLRAHEQAKKFPGVPLSFPHAEDEVQAAAPTAETPPVDKSVPVRPSPAESEASGPRLSKHPIEDTETVENSQAPGPRPSGVESADTLAFPPGNQLR